jgi:hypothetical protein
MSLPDTVATCQAARRNMTLAAAFMDNQATTCPAGGGGTAHAGGAPETDRERSIEAMAPLLQAALDPAAPEWAARNIEQGLVGGAAGDGVSGLLRGLSYNALVWVPLAGVLVFALTLAVHVLTRLALGRKLEGLGLEQQLVSSQHALFVAVFAIQIVPFTYLAAEFLFKRWTAAYFVGDDRHACALGAMVGFMIVSHAYLYCMESGLRVLIKPSPLLLVHHALFFLLLACGLWLGPSMLLIKVWGRGGV